MPRKRKPKTVEMSVETDLSEDLWVNPRSNLRGPDGNRAWDGKGSNISPYRDGRFLELADIALGLKKTEPAAKKKRTVAAAMETTDAHEMGKKTEPYKS